MTSVLYGAMKTKVGEGEDDGENGGGSSLSFDISSKVRNCTTTLCLPESSYQPKILCHMYNLGLVSCFFLALQEICKQFFLLKQLYDIGPWCEV